MFIQNFKNFKNYNNDFYLNLNLLPTTFSEYFKSLKIQLYKEAIKNNSLFVGRTQYFLDNFNDNSQLDGTHSPFNILKKIQVLLENYTIKDINLATTAEQGAGAGAGAGEHSKIIFNKRGDVRNPELFNLMFEFNNLINNKLNKLNIF